jgi:hypothetical protein
LGKGEQSGVFSWMALLFPVTPLGLHEDCDPGRSGNFGMQRTAKSKESGTLDNSGNALVQCEVSLIRFPQGLGAVGIWIFGACQD